MMGGARMPFGVFTRSQRWLFPPSLDELLPVDHPARFVAAMVDESDLDALGIRSVPDDLGAPAYHPGMLLACWLYGFMTRVRSTRKLERACRENVAFMWLTGMQRPDHVTLWRFYKHNRATMKKLFKYTVQVSVKAGFVGFALQAIDGSKVPVASSKSLKDMAALNQLLQQVDAEIAALEEENGQDQDEPPGNRRLRISKKGELRERVLKAMAQLRPEGGDARDGPPGGTLSASGKEKMASVTDPDARLMKGSHGWEVGYNAQAVVDSESQIIVAADVIDEEADNNELIPLLNEAEGNTGQMAETTVADSGYFSDPNLERATGRTDLHMPDPRLNRKKDHPLTWPYHKDHFRRDGTEDAYICPQGKKLTHSRTRPASHHGRHQLRIYQCHDCTGCPVRHDCTRAAHGRAIAISGYESVVQAHRQKMQTYEARRLMQLRKLIVEPVFGIIKEQMDTSRFLLRGLGNVQAEWHLLCAAFNLRKLYKYWWKPRVAATRAAV